MVHLRALPRLRTREGSAVLTVLTVSVLEIVVLSAVPMQERPAIGGALIGATAAVLVVAGVVWRRLQSPRRTAAPADQTTDGPWFTARTLEDFPTEAVHPLVLEPHAPSLNALYTAWVFVRQGYDSRWIARHLDLPTDVVLLLVESARRQAAINATKEH
ncbi:hypothetical protein P3T36_003913 [Kitasatospora sp. MAP12-15]|uniref:hypothetical protein n=1 Tax=unclassified Kitasatospora TaxID=2633591 RepID=UPI002474E011|nr:hypothetical protein [Kitasatospora sp. MAP12-44]MDH6108443.1 hypothetical protein [Kitasatospora sp. MAP12-44]